MSFEKVTLYLKYNKRVTIWLIINFTIIFITSGFMLPLIIFNLVLYAIALKIATSDTVEKLYLMLEDARPLVMQREINRIQPLFDEVCKEAKKESPHLPDCNIFITDTMLINAFAVGKRSIILTRGITETMTDEELKAIIAHEVGHIANGDTFQIAIMKIGTGIFVPLLIIARAVGSMIEGTTQGSKFVIEGFKKTIDVLLFLYTIIGTLLLVSNGRKAEYLADEYACKLGYKDGLLSSFYKTYDIDVEDKKKPYKRFQATHPRLPYRIQHLERIES